jgi:DUF4097 and DUF4098 domain-containing protein YvlB
MRPAIRVLVMVLCLSAPAFAYDQVFDQTYPLPHGGTFTLENVNGSVQVDGWERDQVEVRAIKTAERDREDLDRVKIEVETHPGEVAVRTRYPQGTGVDVTVDYRVRVPSRVLLARIETVNGSVVIRGVDGSGRLRSVNGNVEVLDSAGRFSARTTNGNLRLELRRLADGAPMALETVNGSVVLALPSDAQAALDVRSMNGDFRSDLPVAAQGAFSTRAFRGRLGSGGSEISIRTVNGGIRVVLERPSV